MSQPGAALRARAAEVLHAVLDQGRSLKAVLAPALAETPDSRDRALLEALCFETLRWKRRYDHALSVWMDRPLPSRDGRIGALLRIGLAQIDAMQLPAHASVAATAEAARLLDRPKAVGLVNAILRRALREGLPQSDSPAIRASHPDWLVAALERDWPTQWPQILEQNNLAAPMWLRVNRQQIDRDDYCARLAEAGIGHRVPDGFDDALVLDAPRSPTTLPGWAEGQVSVQDGAAQRVAALLPIAADARVLDACAAPGGKAAHLLERHPAIRLTALDCDARRLDRAGETLSRLRLGPLEAVLAADAGKPADWWDGRPFDAIVIDAPCSATGVIRRQPDIKWHRRERDIAGLIAQQSRLLAGLWPLLRPGGVLLYVTCSVLAKENSGRVSRFLASTPDAQALPLPDWAGREADVGRQRLPGDEQCDGFYYALLSRRADS
ncbi:MAG: 16S rRNA (cytosine(967)-C(5))-methyltransferase RsmB [Xanthomonadaceae bacterium]|nr:16S rRNA (cytosine(967)-C(5))-methyltransferase RsmB [Xanthomonadaceae bacterium]